MLEWAYLLPNSQQVWVWDCCYHPRILPVSETRRPGLDSRIAWHLGEVLTVPGKMLNISQHNPVWLLDAATEGRVTWPANDNSKAWTCSCIFWIDCWCSRSRCCCFACAKLNWSRYCTTASPMAYCMSASRWPHKIVNSVASSCWWAVDSTSTALRASEASWTNWACSVNFVWSSTCCNCKASYASW